MEITPNADESEHKRLIKSNSNAKTNKCCFCIRLDLGVKILAYFNICEVIGFTIGIAYMITKIDAKEGLLTLMCTAGAIVIALFWVNWLINESKDNLNLVNKAYLISIPYLVVTSLVKMYIQKEPTSTLGLIAVRPIILLYFWSVINRY